MVAIVIQNHCNGEYLEEVITTFDHDFSSEYYWRGAPQLLKKTPGSNNDDCVFKNAVSRWAIERKREGVNMGVKEGSPVAAAAASVGDTTK
jgi:hypothetical protein